MKPIIAALLLVPCTFLATVPAYAGDERSHLENRLERQHDRIDAGIDSGALTHKEARELNREQKRLRKMARKIQKDGHVTKKEARRLTRRLNRASHRIHDYKHNAGYRRVKTERCFGFRDSWRSGHGHRWSYELDLVPRLSRR